MLTTREHDERAVARVLGVLFLGAFAMGTAEMLAVGLIDLVALDLRVSVPAAGALVTANALGLALGGPLLTFLSVRVDRRPVLLVALTGFVLLNLVPVFVADLADLLVARALVGALQGLFIAAAITTATAVSAPERSGRAMAVVISGFASASALGLPLGTLLGQAVGWRGAFLAVVGLGVVVLVLVAVVVPSVPAESGARGAGQLRDALAPRVLVVLGFCFLVFTALQSAMTYLVPFLREVTGVTGAAVSAFLLAYGVATTLGSWAGGRFADLDAARALVLGSLGVTGSLVLLAAGGGAVALAAAAVVGLGLFAMGMAPSMQKRVVDLAGAAAPLASSFPASAVNAGIATGSLVGGLAIEVAGVPAAPVTGAVVAVLAVVVAWAGRGLAPRPVRSGRRPQAGSVRRTGPSGRPGTAPRTPSAVGRMPRQPG